MGNTPNIRFKGFTDDWEQRKLGTLCSLITKGTTPKDKSGNGEVNFVKVENIDTDNGEVTSMSKISVEEHEGYLKRSRLEENDILFSIAGTLGRVSVVKPSILPANTNQALAIIRTNEGYIPYLTTVLKGPAVEDFIRRNPTIGAQPNLSLEQVNNLDISYPEYDEQVKIGDYFALLDNLITLHQRKSFSKNRKKIVWEQRKLEDVVEFLDTIRKPLEGAKRTPGPYPYYGASGIVDYVDGYLFDEELVLLSEDGANITDRNYPVCFLASGKYWVNNHAHVLRTKDGNENKFICNSLERKDYKQYNSGMAMPKLNQEVCRSIPINCPSFDEQKKIGAYLNNLDNLITLHQRKCDEIKEVKKFMLQNMFPQKG